MAVRVIIFSVLALALLGCAPGSDDSAETATIRHTPVLRPSSTARPLPTATATATMTATAIPRAQPPIDPIPFPTSPPWTPAPLMTIDECVAEQVPPWLCLHPDAVRTCMIELSPYWLDICPSPISIIDTCIQELTPRGGDDIFPGGWRALCPWAAIGPTAGVCRIALVGRWQPLCSSGTNAAILCVETVGRWFFLCYP